MKISCELIRHNDNSNAEQFLLITIDSSGKEIKLDYNTYKSIFAERMTVCPSIPEVVSEDEKATTSQVQKTNNSALSHIVEGLSIDEDLFQRDNELIVESNVGQILELPWEDIHDSLVVFRKVAGSTACKIDDCRNNILFLISSADIIDGNNEPNLKAKIQKETTGIIGHAINIDPKHVKIDSIHVIKHATEEMLKSIPWDNYDLIHIMMHSTNSGELCLESTDLYNYKVGVPLKIQGLVDKFNESKFRLIFFSSCNTGRTSDNSNMAFHVAQDGVAEYAIGYKDKIGESSAEEFAGKFYDYLFSSSRMDIFEAYKKAVIDYFGKEPSRKQLGYVPMLYIN